MTKKDTQLMKNNNSVPKKISVFLTGLLLTTSLYAQWQQADNGITNHVYTAIGSNGENVFIGSGSVNLYKSADNGSSWNTVNNGISGMVTMLDASNGNLFAVTANGVYLSNNNGASWSLQNNGLALNFAGQSIFADADTLFSGSYYEVFYSVNKGSTWTARNTGFPPNARVQSFAKNGNTVFAGTNGYGLYKTTNNGLNWSLTGNGGQQVPFSEVKSVYVFDAKVFASFSGTLYVSTDNGATWATATNDLNGAYVNCITHRGGTLFVGTNTGIFHSLDGGSTWVNLNANLTNPVISHIGFNASKIFICAQNVAIYVRDLQQVLSLETLSSINELCIYPNPVNEKLTVSLPENSSKKEGVLFDNAGKELQRFLLKGGENTLNVNHLESGMYFLEINGQSTKLIKSN
jgi:photosystem II stability/assembly factor-like uncharacterized protein